MDGKEYYEQSENERMEALERIKKELILEPQRPDEFTRKELEELLGLTDKGVEYRMNNLVREGKAKIRKGPNRQGRIVCLYRML